MALVDLAEVLVVERGGALGEVHLDVRGQTGVARLGHSLGDRLDELLGPSRLVGEDGEPIPQIELARVVERCLREDLERREAIAEVLLHGGETEVEREPVLLGRRGRDEHPEHVPLLLELTRGRVGRLEQDRCVLARLGEGHELLDESDHLGVRVRVRRVDWVESRSRARASRRRAPRAGS